MRISDWSSDVFSSDLRRTYCPHAAADLTAETFAQAWQQRCRYDSERGTGRAWIFGIAGNLFKQWLRQGLVRTKARARKSVVQGKRGSGRVVLGGSRIIKTQKKIQNNSRTTDMK